MIQRLKGWRTFIFGALVTLVGLLTSLMDDQAVKAWLDAHPKWASNAALVAGLGTVILRSITTTPMGQAHQDPPEDGRND